MAAGVAVVRAMLGRADVQLARNRYRPIELEQSGQIPSQVRVARYCCLHHPARQAAALRPISHDQHKLVALRRPPRPALPASAVLQGAGRCTAASQQAMTPLYSPCAHNALTAL